MRVRRLENWHCYNKESPVAAGLSYTAVTPNRAVGAVAL